MPENRRVKRNGAVSNASDSSVHNIEEAIRRLKVRGDENQDGDGAFPERPGEPDCIHYLRTGTCGFGSLCRFNHPTYVGQIPQYVGEPPERFGEPDCLYYMRTGLCKFGSTCKFHHPKDRNGAGPLLLNVLGLPMRQQEKPCSHYMRTGLCKFGVACRFHHPQPDGTDFPVPGSFTYLSNGSPVAPSSGAPPIGGLPAWSLPKATYISDPNLQHPQTYMPLVLSPTQSVVPAQGWSPYMGNLSPISSTSIYGSSGSIGQAQVYPTAPAFHLPERPDQPECRNFISTGSCKYGSDCRYHHPREKSLQFAASSLGPLGLPLRPGQAICSYYSMYGLCKYGPTCRFDHPLVGYSYNYSLSMPSVSIIDPSLLPATNSATLQSFESSPKSLKVSGWIRKTETAINGNPNAGSSELPHK